MKCCKVLPSVVLDSIRLQESFSGVGFDGTSYLDSWGAVNFLNLRVSRQLCLVGMISGATLPFLPRCFF